MKAGFTAVSGLDGVYVARAGKLSSIALRLRDDSLCLYSPVSGLETVLKEQSSELGEVSTLFAPNHYHNKGLASHLNAFPNASLYCSAAAKPRLQKITGFDFQPLDDLKRRLIDGQTLHEPKGLKTGEVWVQVQSGTDGALIVTDAFSSALQPPGVYGDEVGILGTFPRYGVNDAEAYIAWAMRFISMAPLSMLLPCHGSPVRADDLAVQLNSLLQEGF